MQILETNPATGQLPPANQQLIPEFFNPAHIMTENISRQFCRIPSFARYMGRYFNIAYPKCSVVHLFYYDAVCKPSVTNKRLLLGSKTDLAIHLSDSQIVVLLSKELKTPTISATHRHLSIITSPYTNNQHDQYCSVRSCEPLP